MSVSEMARREAEELSELSPGRTWPLSPRRSVYLAGPIAGLSYVEAVNWRTGVRADLARHGLIGVSPMRDKVELSGESSLTGNYPEHVMSTERAIAARDFYDVSHCDAILAFLPEEYNLRRPSWGTAIELGWAGACGKPVVLVTDDPSLMNHPLARRICGWIVPDLSAGVNCLASIFRPYVEG